MRRLSEDGANVIALDLDAAGAKKAVEGLPTEALGVAADITSRAEVNNAVDEAVGRFGKLTSSSTTPASPATACSTRWATTTGTSSWRRT